jgi:hypothetical protein
MKECSIQFGQKSVFSRTLFFVTGKYLNLMNANQLKDNDAFSVFSNFFCKNICVIFYWNLSV